MNLNLDEINYVKKFIIEKKYIYVEEQVEILDHFLSLLEDKKDEYENIPFEQLASFVYEENKVELKSIKQSVRKNYLQKYKKDFLKNLAGHVSFKYITLYIIITFLYYLYLNLIRDHLSILTIFIPALLLLPISMLDYRRKFEPAKGKFLINRYASRFLILQSAFQLYPCNIILSLGGNWGITQNIMFILISSVLVFQIVLFRAFIKTILVEAESCKKMEEDYKLVDYQ